MTKRLMLAMGLWFLLLLVMMNLFKQDEQEQAADPAIESTEAPGVTQGVQTDGRDPARMVLRQADAPDQAEPIADIRTENYEITLDAIDASVSSLKFRRYLEEGAPIDFIEENIEDYANFKVSFDGFELDEPPAVWAHRQEGELEHVFTRQVGSGFGRGLTLEKRYIFYQDAWHFDLELRLLNQSAEKWAAYRDIAYSLIWGSPTDWLFDKEARSAYDTLSLAVYHAGDDKLERIDKDGDVKSFRWIGLEDRYFLFSVIPLSQGDTQNPAVETASIKTAEYNGMPTRLFALNRHKLTLPAGEEARDTYRVFLGPRKYNLLTDDVYAPYHLSAVFDSFVLIKWLSIAFEQLMLLIYSLISNYGIVIIIVTILIKILLHPLTKKSFVSMRKMQLLQPKMAAIKEQFKSDPKRLNEEMMKLYKKEGVNPMGGCLPMLLQLPVFIALYQILPRFADLKNVSFLWIKDLSSPDTVALLSFFKDIPLLPYRLNILPLIMVAFSVWQARISNSKKEPGDAVQQQQGKMMMMMPILFLFLFWNMPSGLVLYWTVQTVMSMVQQMQINRKYSADTAKPI